MQSDTRVVHSEVIKADRSGCKIMPGLNSAKSQQIATGQKSTYAIPWNTTLPSLNFIFFSNSVWAEELLKAAWGEGRKDQTHSSA